MNLVTTIAVWAGLSLLIVVTVTLLIALVAIIIVAIWQDTPVGHRTRTTWQAIRGRFDKTIAPVTVPGKIMGIPVELTHLDSKLIKAIMTDTELGTVLHLTRISDTETQAVAFHTDEQGIRCEGCNRDKPLDTELDSDMVAEFVSTMHQVRAERQVVRRMIDIFGG